MKLNEYQEKSMTTCMPSSANFSYMFLNLVGEVGEFASKVAKHIRKGGMKIIDDDLEIIPNESKPFTSHDEDELMKEAGDILWQLSGLCQVM